MTNAVHNPQLVVANVVYDELGTRLGFRRRISTREILVELVQGIKGTGQLDERFLRHLDSRQQRVMRRIHAAFTGSYQELAERMQCSLAQAEWTIDGVIFHLL